MTLPALRSLLLGAQLSEGLHRQVSPSRLQTLTLEPSTAQQDHAPTWALVPPLARFLSVSFSSSHSTLSPVNRSGLRSLPLAIQALSNPRLDPVLSSMLDHPLSPASTRILSSKVRIASDFNGLTPVGPKLSNHSRSRSEMQPPAVSGAQALNGQQSTLSSLAQPPASK